MLLGVCWGAEVSRGVLCLGLGVEHLRNVSKKKMREICNGEQGQCCAGQGWWGRGQSLGAWGSLQAVPWGFTSALFPSLEVLQPLEKDAEASVSSLAAQTTLILTSLEQKTRSGWSLWLLCCWPWGALER